MKYYQAVKTSGQTLGGKLRLGLFAAVALGASLLVPGVSFAQGGSGGGGGGTGGGTGGGGSTTTAVCQPLQSYKLNPGYMPSGGNAAAVWVSYSMKQCDSTVPVAFVANFYDSVSGDFVAQRSGMKLSDTLDFEPAAFDTTYRVELYVLNPNDYSAVQAHVTDTVTTPSPKTGAPGL